MSDRRQRTGPIPSEYQQRKKQTNRGRKGYAATSVAFCRGRKRLRLPGSDQKRKRLDGLWYSDNHFTAQAACRAKILERSARGRTTRHQVLLATRAIATKAAYSYLTTTVLCCAHSEQLNMR
jgi:hypothetical protein